MRQDRSSKVQDVELAQGSAVELGGGAGERDDPSLTVPKTCDSSATPWRVAPEKGVSLVD